MFIPYRDENPTERFAVVTFLIIIANILVFIYQIFGESGFSQITYQYGLIPVEIFTGRNLPHSERISPYLSLFTYMFCHGSILHILFNMLFLWIFGNNVEDKMTRKGFLIFYLLIGIISAMAFTVRWSVLETPLVGASGAISGILGAYLFLFPMARVYVWVLLFVIRIPALIFLPLWFIMQVFGFMGSTAGGAGNVAWLSHITGFIAGIILFKFFTRR